MASRMGTARPGSIQQTYLAVETAVPVAALSAASKGGLGRVPMRDGNDTQAGLSSPEHAANLSGLFLGCAEILDRYIQTTDGKTGLGSLRHDRLHSDAVFRRTSISQLPGLLGAGLSRR